jgi:hypothetical protein
MRITHRRFLSLTILSLSLVLLQVFPSTLDAVSLAEKYSVASKQECQGTIGGELILDFSRHVYSFTASNTGDAEEAGNASDSFKFTCGGELDLGGSLEKWEAGSIQDDGIVVFKCIVLTPEPQVRIWPFSCDW